MIGLSDLVLVMFDARHPEPGAMRDTLQHLVVETMNRPDSSKFLFILNQLDTSASEDNPEDVVAAWLRALGEVGMTTGRFYTIFSPLGAAHRRPDPRERFEAKRDADLAEIYERMEQVEVERAYRIIASLKQVSDELADESLPLLEQATRRWRSRTLWLDLIALGVLAGRFPGLEHLRRRLAGLTYAPAWIDWLAGQGVEVDKRMGIIGGALLLLLVHMGARRSAASLVRGWLRKTAQGQGPARRHRRRLRPQHQALRAGVHGLTARGRRLV
jgi:hypothetical protein